MSQPEVAQTVKILSRWGGVIGEFPGANIREALLNARASGADLRDADLSGADLRDADLSGAVLRGAYLSGADLRGAYLSGADLRGAYLSGADLRGAVLRGADLSGADLSGADLSGADLRDADLSGAVLRGADLTPIRDDLWAVLSSAPAEVQGLRLALVEGRVDGSTYSGECACLVGTIANLRGVGYGCLDLLRPNSSRPAERWFLAIAKGDTPETNQFSRLAIEWIDQWLAGVLSAFGPAEGGSAQQEAPCEA